MRENKQNGRQSVLHGFMQRLVLVFQSKMRSHEDESNILDNLLTSVHAKTPLQNLFHFKVFLVNKESKLLNTN